MGIYRSQNNQAFIPFVPDRIPWDFKTVLLSRRNSFYLKDTTGGDADDSSKRCVAYFVRILLVDGSEGPHSQPPL